jgi:hypothetical protein
MPVPGPQQKRASYSPPAEPGRLLLPPGDRNGGEGSGGGGGGGGSAGGGGEGNGGSGGAEGGNV